MTPTEMENPMTDDQTPPTEHDETPAAETPADEAPAAAETPADETPAAGEPETFPRKVVTDLRKENAKYRERAQQSDTLATRLHTSLVAATGKLADPTDLEFSEDHLEDPEALAAAVDDLLTRKPHLKARRVTGDVGQGTRGKTGGGVDLLDAMRGTL